MEEPDADETLNIGELKKLSGGDTYWARDLFEKGKSAREVKPMFTLTFICNKLPKLKYSDKATWNRLRVIPFESTFVEPGQPCPKTFEEQLLEKKFPMDKQFDSKIQGMVGAFAWYLLEWRKKVTIRVEPEKVKEATAVYRRQNDIYRQFIEENITEDKNSYISLAEIYAHFKEWYKEGWSNMTVPIKNEVKEYFERLWGDTEKGYRWHGYRIRTLQEDLDAGNAIVLEDDDLINYNDENGKALPPM
jgi:phage/plasmid-associated DNA primase